MAATDLEIGGGLVIPAAELRESASRSSGPGGQHVNKTSTRVTLRWNVLRSETLSERTRARLVERLGARLTRGGDIVVHVGDERSRERNRRVARERLAEWLADALRVPRVRVETRPSRGAREQRLRAKRVRSDVKRSRRRVDDASD